MFAPSPFILAGYVCPETGRIAIELKSFAQSEFRGRVYAYLFDSKALAVGKPFWLMIDSIDDAADGAYDLWLSNGSCVQAAKPELVVFVSPVIAKALSITDVP